MPKSVLCTFSKLIFIIFTPHTHTYSVHDCGVADLARPDSGSIDYTTTTFNSVATFSCQSDLVLSGVTKRVCGFDGWSNINPFCGR